MAKTDTKTVFAGIELKCPVIVGSCSLTASVPGIVAFEKAGAGAVVLKSLFEESILREMDSAGEYMDHPEAYDYIFNSLGDKVVSEYCGLIRRAKAECGIPIIASIACRSDGKWTEFAGKIEEAGADAIELNVMTLCTGKDYRNGDFEKMHADIVKHVCDATRLPVIVKLGSNISNPVSLSDSLHARGARGAVLFNRFYPTDIDVEKLDFTLSDPFTRASELSQSIRWAGIISAALPQLPLAVSGGVHDWSGVAKSLLCGASAVEVASAIIMNGPEWISKAVSGLEDWMSRKGFESIDSFRGKMNAADIENADRLMRTQFLKYFGGIH